MAPDASERRSGRAASPLLAGDLRRLIEKYSLPPGMFEEIIAGVEMDLTILRYRTFEELRVYCYRVASAVGLVSIEIFGYRNPGCKEYAIELGLALQMTNIIRDVGKDLQDGRIYLPQEDLARFNYSATELQGRHYNECFLRLMEFEAARARDFFSRAAAALPPRDRTNRAGQISRLRKRISVKQAGESRPNRDATSQIFFEFAAASIRLSRWLRKA